MGASLTEIRKTQSEKQTHTRTRPVLTCTFQSYVTQGDMVCIHIQTLWSVSAPGVMSLGFRLIFLCWPLEPDSQAEAVSAGSQWTAVSTYTSSWKNSFWKPREHRVIPSIIKSYSHFFRNNHQEGRYAVSPCVH